MSEKELFKAIFSHFESLYDGLSMKGSLVYYKGDLKFNTDGFNLLFNLTRLTSILKDELR